MKYVLVDCISSFRQRYAIAVPDDFSNEKAKNGQVILLPVKMLKNFLNTTSVNKFHLCV